MSVNNKTGGIQVYDNLTHVLHNEVKLGNIIYYIHKCNDIINALNNKFQINTTTDKTYLRSFRQSCTFTTNQPPTSDEVIEISDSTRNKTDLG